MDSNNMNDNNSTNTNNVKTVVIVSLPPQDNPSLGKTITAFTLSSHDSHHQQHSSSNLDRQSLSLPTQSPPLTPQRSSSWKNFILGNQRRVFAFLGVSLFAIIIIYSYYYFLPNNMFHRLNNSNDDNDKKVMSFVFPLYSKAKSSALWDGNVELKLRRFVGFNESFPRSGGGKMDSFGSVSAKVVAGSSSVVVPVEGNVYPDGLYYTIMLVGNPPRPYYLDIDTGSGLTWIQCDAPCTSCAKGANALYKPNKRNIIPYDNYLCKEVQQNQRSENCEGCKQCDYEIEYVDHSSSIGVLARDELHLVAANGFNAKLNVVFGCAYDQQGMLLNTLAKTDGIIGLSRSKISLPSQLASQGIINNVVGHCLTTDAGGGGYMFFGDEFVPQWGMSWAPMLRRQSLDFYHTEISRMTYGSDTITLDGKNGKAGQVILDSGSSYTYFPKQAYFDLVSSVEEQSAMELVLDKSDPTLPICWRPEFPISSINEVKNFFKTLVLQFGRRWWIVSTKLKIPPEGYLIISDKGNVCLGILDGRDVHDGSTIILGDISMHGQLVVYDNVKQRIGWKQSECVQSQTSKSLSFFEV